MKKKYLFRIILISQLILLFGCENSRDEMGDKLPISEIGFELETKIITTKTTDGKEETLSIKDSKQDLTVVLGDDFVEYGDLDKKTLISFSEKKIFSFDKHGEQISDISLYANVGFRSMELLNRVMLNKMFSSAQLNVGKFNDITLNEHLFSVASKEKNKSAIIKKETSDHFSYYSEENHLFSYSKENIDKLEKQEMSQFVKFLRYSYGIHPQILSKFEKKSSLPKNIKITFYELNKVREIELSTTKYDNVIEEYRALVPSNFSKSFGNTKFSNIIKKAQKLSDEDIKKKYRAILDRAVRSAEQKKYLPAMLSFLSYSNLGLDVDKTLPKEFFKFKTDIIRNNDVRKLLYAINIDNFSKNPKLVMDILDELEKKGGKDIDMVLIFKANHLLSSAKQGSGKAGAAKEYSQKQDRKSEAMDLFNRALSQNPLLAGAWIDLGKILYKDFNATEAWRCYDIAKKLSLNHSMLKPIYEAEKRMVLRHPEFF
ncbi:MAG: tetratricopeptide (TPR) repeat protein [Myxococcota bacterium]|jgi:tetratricopeptide (TPR) repeat protein